MTGNDADAADATQEALIAIVRGIGRFDGRSRFGTWAYRVATNACLDELRRRKRRPQPSDDEIMTHGSTADSESTNPGPEDVAVRLDIDQALMQLSPEFRAPVILRDLSALDYAEIAEILDLPIGTVKSRIARGRALLATLLSDTRNRDSDRNRPTR